MPEETNHDINILELPYNYGVSQTEIDQLDMNRMLSWSMISSTPKFYALFIMYFQYKEFTSKELETEMLRKYTPEDLQHYSDTEKEIMPATIAMDTGKKTIRYFKPFIARVLKDEGPNGLTIVLFHEILHFILAHTWLPSSIISEINLDQEKQYVLDIVNDLAVNRMLQSVGVLDSYMDNIPEGLLSQGSWPDANTDSFVMNYKNDNGDTEEMFKLKDISEKTSVIMYYEVISQLQDNNSGDGGGNELDFLTPNMVSALRDQVMDTLDYGNSNDPNTQADMVRDNELIRNAIRTNPDLLNEMLDRFRGTGSLAFDNYIDDILDPHLDWRSILRLHMENVMNKRKSMSGEAVMKPRKKLLPHRMFYPQFYAPASMNILFCIDTSGSMSDNDISLAYGAILELVEEFSDDIDIQIGVLFHEMMLQRTLYISNSEEGYDVVSKNIQNMNIKGRGGTSHSDVYNALSKGKIADGCDNFEVVSDIEYVDEFEYHTLVIVSDLYSDIDMELIELIPHDIDQIYICTKDHSESAAEFIRSTKYPLAVMDERE